MKKNLLILFALMLGVLNAKAQDPCTNITTVTCGTNITFATIAGNGDPSYPLNVGGCNGSSAQGGKEQIYSFTPTQTGTYEFEITSVSGGFVQYLWKQASLGCDSTGWNCIDRSNSVGSVGAVNFTSGTTYYLLANAEPTTALSHTFRVKCAKVVCNDVLPLTCGTATTFGPIIGYGDPNYALNVGGCNGSSAQGGKEQIYSFTPTQTGTYEFSVTSASGGVAQYMWKQASLGCDNTGWNCINRSNSVESIGAVNFTAGTNYYILVNAEPTTSLTHIFMVKCAKVVCNDVLPLTCGTLTTLGPIIGYGDPNYSLNVGGCNGSSAQGGKEQIYSFTPTQTGTYEFEVTSASGGVAQYMWKQASLGCDNTGWNCINRSNSVESIGAVNFASGTTYYILVNAEPTSSLTHIFRVKCAKVVCNDILPLTCGTLTTFGSIGYGDSDYALNVGGCNGSNAQGGKEQIYSFTPTQTGTYEFEVTSASGGVAQYMWKQASLGCNNTGWNCINRSNSIESIGAVNFIAGTTYYILVNAEPTSSLTHIFKVICAKIVCNDILPLACGASATLGPIIGYGDPDYALNVGGCNGSNAQGGKEQIYQLPASSTPYQIEITASSGGYMQYMWKPVSLGCNNTGWSCLARKNNNGIITTTIPASNSPVYLLVNAEPTSSITHIFTVSCTTLSSNNFNIDKEISIYPNPTSSIININSSANIAMDKVLITDLTGKIILEQTHNTSQINVENLSIGVYIIQVYSGNNKYQNKFIKQ